MMISSYFYFSMVLDEITANIKINDCQKIEKIISPELSNNKGKPSENPKLSGLGPTKRGYTVVE